MGSTPFSTSHKELFDHYAKVTKTRTKVVQWLIGDQDFIADVEMDIGNEGVKMLPVADLQKLMRFAALDTRAASVIGSMDGGDVDKSKSEIDDGLALATQMATSLKASYNDATKATARKDKADAKERAKMEKQTADKAKAAAKAAAASVSKASHAPPRLPTTCTMDHAHEKELTVERIAHKDLAASAVDGKSPFIVTGHTKLDELVKTDSFTSVFKVFATQYPSASQAKVEGRVQAPMKPANLQGDTQKFLRMCVPFESLAIPEDDADASCHSPMPLDAVSGLCVSSNSFDSGHLRHVS